MELAREKLRINDLLIFIKIIKTRTHSAHALIFGGEIFACTVGLCKEEKQIADLLDKFVTSAGVSRSDAFYIQLFRERLSEKVHATIQKCVVGGFEGTVLQRKLKGWYGRPRTYVCEH